MKTPTLILAGWLLSCGFVIGQAPAPTVVEPTAATARDGFTMGGTTVLFTLNGHTQKVDKDVILGNGLRVQPDGSVTLPNGQKGTLHNNQILTLQGAFEDVALTPQGTAPVTSGGSPAKKPGEDVGISASDGISISGTDALITRNGVSERLSKEMRLDNGTRVQPDGKVTLPNGTHITLRADQVLTFDGVLRPVAPRTNTSAAGTGAQVPP